MCNRGMQSAKSAKTDLQSPCKNFTNFLKLVGACMESVLAWDNTLNAGH